MYVYFLSKLLLEISTIASWLSIVPWLLLVLRQLKCLCPHASSHLLRKQRNADNDMVLFHLLKLPLLEKSIFSFLPHYDLILHWITFFKNTGRTSKLHQRDDLHQAQAASQQKNAFLEPEQCLQRHRQTKAMLPGLLTSKNATIQIVFSSLLY